MEIGNKDVYEYILNLADDKTTINMIRANPKVFDNERFYEKVMRKRYPLLIDFRKENETWKALYLRMVYNLATLQEKYKIPYIPTKGCNPEKLLRSGGAAAVYAEALSCAAAGGNIPLIDYLLKKGATDLVGAINSAAEYSNLDTVRYLMGRRAEITPSVLQYAASGGKIDAMKFALDILRPQGFDINRYSTQIALQLAIIHEHLNAVKFLVDNGFIVRQEHIDLAVKYNKPEITKYLKQFVQN